MQKVTSSFNHSALAFQKKVLGHFSHPKMFQNCISLCNENYSILVKNSLPGILLGLFKSIVDLEEWYRVL